MTEGEYCGGEIHWVGKSSQNLFWKVKLTCTTNMEQTWREGCLSWHRLQRSLFGPRSCRTRAEAFARYRRSLSLRRSLLLRLHRFCASKTHSHRRRRRHRQRSSSFQAGTRSPKTKREAGQPLPLLLLLRRCGYLRSS